jgi:8-oxo-dGTP diphosphatase
MTSHTVLFGTTNPAKFKLMQSFVAELPVTLVSLRDVGINVTVAEDGHSPEENARKKAAAYYAHARMPTLALDAGLTIDRFPASKQPGVHVRRIVGGTQAASDEEMIRYYSNELASVGGESTGCWHVALALAAGNDSIHYQMYCETYTVPVLFTSEVYPARIKGAPLSSLMRDIHTGQYFAEIDATQRPDTQHIRKLLARLIHNLVS